MISLVVLGKLLCRSLIIGSMTGHIPFEAAGKPDRSVSCPKKSEISSTACMPVQSQWHITLIFFFFCTPFTNSDLLNFPVLTNGKYMYP